MFPFSDWNAWSGLTFTWPDESTICEHECFSRLWFIKVRNDLGIKLLLSLEKYFFVVLKIKYTHNN